MLRNSGKQVDTDRAKQGRDGQVLLHPRARTSVARRGATRRIYMRVISPDGQGAARPSESGNRFQFEGVEGEYSAKREVNYQGQPLDACIFWTASGEELRTGQYIVEVYEGRIPGVEVPAFDLK
jgi:hypothetical protein